MVPSLIIITKYVLTSSEHLSGNYTVATSRIFCLIVPNMNILRANQRSPIWYVKYNLLCLLNCIENMKEFGPTKDRWEGSMEGEKCIQYLAACPD